MSFLNLEDTPGTFVGQALKVLRVDAGETALEFADLWTVPHKSMHENGGSDEIDVTGLSGELADPQPPKTHAASHQHGGSDEIDVTGLPGLLADPQKIPKGAPCYANIPTGIVSWSSDAGTWITVGTLKVYVPTGIPNAYAYVNLGSEHEGTWARFRFILAGVTSGEISTASATPQWLGEASVSGITTGWRDLQLQLYGYPGIGVTMHGVYIVGGP